MILNPRLELLLATSNAGKVRELEEALDALPISLRRLSEFPNVAPVDEVGRTYEDNAIIKALSYAKQTGICCLADDSGLEVAALGGRPGVFSARFAGEEASDRERTDELLTALLPYQDRERAAQFVCCMAFAGWPSTDSEPATGNPRVFHVSEGRCEGMIAREQRGTGGFGYDPIFIPGGYGQTFGELPGAVKRSLSHRGKALAAMQAFLSQFLTLT